MNMFLRSVLCLMVTAATSAITAQEKALTKAPVVAIAPGQAPRESPKGKEAKGRKLRSALDSKRKDINTKYCRDLGYDVRYAVSRGLKDDASQIVAKIRKADPVYRHLKKLADLVGKAERITDAAKVATARKKLSDRLKKADVEQAKRLVGVAEWCARAGLFAEAYDLCWEALALDLANKKARRALGYRYDGKQKKYISSWEFRMRYEKPKHFLTSEGWFQLKHEQDYKAGKRPWQGEWIPKDLESQRRERSVVSAYAVESEHFRVETTAGRELAWKHCLLLEGFYTRFCRVFIGFFDQKRGAELLFNRGQSGKKFRVVILVDYAQYERLLKAEKGNDPLLRESAGFYSSGEQCSYLYLTGSRERDLSTFYHEVAHQLFAETKPGIRSKTNYWVVEGIATYIETWKKVAGEWVPGGNEKFSGLQRGKAYLASHAKDFELERFVAMQHDDFHASGTDGQSDPELRRLNYALAGSLCYFFMHYRGGVYRHDFVRFLKGFYEGKLHTKSLAELVTLDAGGDGFATLKKQFLEHMAALAVAAEGVP